ncbi:exodeoxyribonuclease VII small subunit [Novosphingobium panipatense]
MSLYEKGEKLRQHCQKRLDAAQARIERIVAGPDGAAASTQPFDL